MACSQTSSSGVNIWVVWQFCYKFSANVQYIGNKEILETRKQWFLVHTRREIISTKFPVICLPCDFTLRVKTLWSDSMIVLSWIKKHPSELKAFVSNRVEKIQKITKRYNWKHVCSNDNPADLVSRGMRMHDFLNSKLWLEGPSWLKQPYENWPTPKLVISPELKKSVSQKYS